MKALERLLMLGLTLPALYAANAEEPDDTRIIKHILQARDEILGGFASTNSGLSNAFLVFWDFDGTIIKGDCSLGLKANGKLLYRGLAQLAIERGLSSVYPPDGGFDNFWIDYTNMEARIGPWLAYPVIPQMLHGAKVDDVLQLSRLHFDRTLSNYFMASSLKIIRALQHGGAESHIISASADVFVKGAAESLGIPLQHIHGIQLRVRNGRLTEEIVYPVTWNTGKREEIQTAVAQLERESPGRKVFILAGSGDSYDTDGPFLKFIATQSWPAGKPIAVFFDGKKEPDEYRGLFY